MNQPDRQFIFGIVAHTTRSRPWHIYVAIFLSSCLVSSAAINIISQPMDIIRLIARLASLTPQERGRDQVFNRRWYKEPLAASYNYHLDFECSKFTAKAIGHISRSTSIIGRRTQVLLCQILKVNKNIMGNEPIVGNYCTIKISSNDTAVALPERKLYEIAVERGVTAVPVIIVHFELDNPFRTSQLEQINDWSNVQVINYRLEGEDRITLFTSTDK